MVSILVLPSDIQADENMGVITGLFYENTAPCSLRINIHNALNGLYFGKTETDEDGRYRIADLPLGEYYLITHPAGVGIRMPMQWRTESLLLSKESPEYTVQKIDGFTVEIIHPKDGENIEIDKVSDINPLVFSWSSYVGAAEYEIEIYSTDKTQQFTSDRITKCSFSFGGMFEDGSTARRRLYRWKLKVFPKNSEWVGISKPHDICVDDLGQIKIYEGEYIRLEFPKWYESTIESMDLINLLDSCYLLEKELAAGQVPSLGPLPGEKQSFLYDPTITFAYSGNPIHFGKNHINENSFPLFTTFHEVGHNFQLGGLPGFMHLLGGEYYDKTAIFFGFCEGFATLASIYITESIDLNALKPNVRNLFIQENRSMREKYMTALDYFENSGPDRNRITPDVIDGLCIRLGDKYGWDIFPVFFRIFLKNKFTDQIFNWAGDDDVKRITIFVAAFSVAANTDLRRDFKKWDFPIDQRYYRKILPLVKKNLIIN